MGGRVYEDGQTFDVDDKAELRPEGYFQSDFTGPENIAVIYFLVVKATKDNCYVEGFWFEKGAGAWKFSGTLELAA